MDQDIWQNILDKLEEHQCAKFRTWFTNTKLVDLSDTEITIMVPTSFAADYLNQNYTQTLEESNCFTADLMRSNSTANRPLLPKSALAGKSQRQNR